MLLRSALLSAIILLGICVPSQADVIDFESGLPFVLGIGQSAILQGFTFTTGGQPVSVLVAPLPAGNCQPACISDGSDTIGAFNGANVLIDPIVPGETFGLDSFDVAGTYKTGSNNNATSIKVIGNLSGGGQVTQTFFIDPASFHTETLDLTFTNLLSVEFDGLQPAGLSSPEFQLDNIVYTPATTTNAAPEPASLILVASGLLALMLAMGRKRQITRSLTSIPQ
jgi:hypothetical protein